MSKLLKKIFKKGKKKGVLKLDLQQPESRYSLDSVKKDNKDDEASLGDHNLKDNKVDKASLDARNLPLKPGSSLAHRKSMDKEPATSNNSSGLRLPSRRKSMGDKPNKPEQLTVTKNAVTKNAVIDNLITNRVIPLLSSNYKINQPPNLADWSNLDPFDQLSVALDSPLKDYDFDGLSTDKVADFLRQIDMTKGNDVSLGNLKNDTLTAVGLSNGIPPVQHSVWVGNPLDATIKKQKAFMDSLEKNKKDNPDWFVVLWTDQSRDTLKNAGADSPAGKMRKWAADNGIILASIDEVFAGKNKMELNEFYKLEQLKGGTGRAAASDIVRLEVLNRFGGIYVDGDKPILVSLDKITEATAVEKKMRIAVSEDDAKGREILKATTTAEQKAEEKGKVIVSEPRPKEVQGFAAANLYGAYQNCALCSTKGNLAIKNIIARIKENYSKDRQQLGNYDKRGRAQRMEVIERTGPSVVRSVVDPKKEGFALMPSGAVNTYTGTTSWTGEKPFTGKRDPQVFINKVKKLRQPSALYAQAKMAAIPPRRLPDSSTLTPELEAKIADVVRKGLTVLSYTIPNEMGRLDLNYLKPHLDGLTLAEQQLAVHATLQTLAQPQFAELAKTVKTLRLPTLRAPKPNDLDLALETLDLLSPGGNLPNLKLNDFTIQDAALEGNLTFLGYAKDKGMLNDLNETAEGWIDGGTSTNNDAFGGKIDVVQAALMGGNRNAIQYLASLDSFKDYKALDTVLKDAATYGQIDTVIALAEAYNRPDSLELLVNQAGFPGRMGVEILERYISTFGENNEVIKKASWVLLKKAVADDALDIIPQLQKLGVDIKDCDATGRTSILKQMVLSAINNQKCLDMLAEAARLGVEDELLMQAGKDENPNLITTQLNKNRPATAQIAVSTYDPEAELAIAHFKFPNSEVGKNDYKNVDVKELTPPQARELVQKALVYAHDRLRASENGRQSRVKEWNDLLESMETVPKLTGDKRLLDLIDQTRKQLDGMIAEQPDRTRMQQKAGEVAAPDLSQRQTTSKLGKIRRVFKPNAVRNKSPDGFVFVPGKGMQKP